ncbi:uncharacterized protein LOC131166370 [Malania oleifera]|uniref:uncharacterized protein LOC131166370 n=1 Tax=Malania oleifera TaxID=397392 RepID=UPI0025ADE5B6|nr:uncharacterized protein LOC131166370 [Malania oleifera]
MGFMFLLMLITVIIFSNLHFLIIASPSPVLSNTLPSDLSEENSLGGKERKGRSVVGTGSGIQAHKHIAGSIGGGISGSRPYSGSENGNHGGSGSGSTDTPGGAALIPIYTAGAANHHQNNHHSSGNRIQGSGRLHGWGATMVAVATLVLHAYV